MNRQVDPDHCHECDHCGEVVILKTVRLDELCPHCGKPMTDQGDEEERSYYDDGPSRFEDSPKYRADMIDAGRGRLVR